MDWPHLAAMARWHGVAPLVYRNLSRHGAETVPAAVREQLRGQAHAIAFRNLAILGELRSLLPRFAARGIRVIPYKGPTLAARFYGDPALRHCADLDLLIRRHHVRGAAEVMRAAGYRSKLTRLDGDLSWLLERHYHLGFWRQDPDLLVEAHWSLTAGRFDFPVDYDDVWRGARPRPIAEGTVDSLAAEDLLVVLCLHLAKHWWQQDLSVKWIVDLSALLAVHRDDLDWPRVDRRARSSGCSRVLTLGLGLAHRLLRAPLPPPVASRVSRDRLVRATATAIRRRLEGDDQRPPVGPAFQPLLYLRLADWNGRRRFLARKSRFFARRLRHGLRPNGFDRAFVALPRPLAFLYPLIRPLRLVYQHRARLVPHLVKWFLG